MSQGAQFAPNMATKSVKKEPQTSTDKLKNLQNCERGLRFYTSAFSGKINFETQKKTSDNMQNNTMRAQSWTNMTQ